MPFIFAMVLLFTGTVYILNNYIRENIYWKICWEFYAFDTEYISQEKIELPKGSYLPFYPKKECFVNARDTNYQWVPTRELAPTGSIMIGNKGVEWYEVIWNSSKGYVPVVIVKMTKTIPWKFIQGAYQ